MNQRLADELDRRAELEGITRASLIEDVLWSVVFPDEPTPSAAERQAKRARKELEMQAFLAEMRARERLSRADREQVRQARLHARREAQFEQKIADAKARWHKKFDGDMPSQNIP